MTFPCVRFVQIIISVGLLALLLSLIDMNTAFDAISEAHPGFLFGTLVVMTCSRLLMPTKWNLLLEAKDITLSWKWLVQVYYVSSFLGSFLPATIGTDSIRIYFLSGMHFSLRKVFSSIIVERLIGFLVMLMLALIGVVLLMIYFGSFQILLSDIAGLLLVEAVIMVGAVLVLLRGNVSERIRSFLLGSSDGGICMTVRQELVKLYQSLLEYKGKSFHLFLFLALTVLEACLAFAAVSVLLSALSISVPTGYLLCFLPVQFLLIRIPISLAGWGVHEAGFVYFLSFVGVPSSIGLVVGFVHHVMLLVALTPGGFWLAFERNRFQVGELSEVRRMRQEVEDSDA